MSTGAGPGEGRLIDPRYAGGRERHRPIGTFWLQMASAKVLGTAAENRISTYRLPSLIGVTLSVLATFWLLAPVVGGLAAFLAAAFAAASPIVALESRYPWPSPWSRRSRSIAQGSEPECTAARRGR